MGLTIRLAGSSKMNKHGQVILPPDVKEALQIKTGQNIGFWIDDDSRTVQLFTQKS